MMILCTLAAAAALQGSIRKAIPAFAHVGPIVVGLTTNHQFDRIYPKAKHVTGSDPRGDRLVHPGSLDFKASTSGGIIFWLEISHWQGLLRKADPRHHNRFGVFGKLAWHEPLEQVQKDFKVYSLTANKIDSNTIELDSPHVIVVLYRGTMPRKEDYTFSLMFDHRQLTTIDVSCDEAW